MAIYHLHVKVIGRKSGSSAVASAAYRSGSRLRDERLDRSHDFSAKRGVVHSEVMLPENAPEAWSDRERLWNDVESFEIRKDAQLAREVEFALPREMTQAQGIELARDFVQAEFVDQGMIADLNVHWDIGEDGMLKPHAHVMLTMRAVVHDAQTREQARGDLIARWDRERQASPDKSRIILTHTNDEVRALNETAREKMREAGILGDEVHVTVERGARNFASGDRVMFLQNERGLDVKNGTLGNVAQVSVQSMTVQTDDGRSVRFDLKDYNRIDHGYAATIHKAQGMTVDRTHVLATPGMDAHGSYVALSRHRDGMDLHYGQDDFANRDRLTRTLSRDRVKDMASDYQRADPAQSYAERRGITFSERVAEIVRKVVPEKVRNMLDSLRPSADRSLGPERDEAYRESVSPTRETAEDRKAALRKARTDALKRHARAVDAIFSAEDAGGKASPEQVKELQEARKVFEGVRPYGSHDAEAAYKKNPELVREAAGGQVNRAIRALQLETEIRTDPSRRADRFVERWQKLDHTGQRQYQAGDIAGYKATRSAMGDMAKSLERDPQLESILAIRKKDLGISFESGRRLGQELAFTHGIDLGRGLGIGI